MAEKRATLLIQLRDKASASISRLRGAVSKLRENWLGVSLAVGAVAAAIGTTVKAFIKQENAVNKLNTALINQGVFTEEASEDLQKYAASLQKVTTVGDETILETQALLATFGATGEELKKATEAALDLSAGLGIDLKASTLLLGKALAGDTATLSRYGIKIAEGTAESEKFNAVLKQVNQRFGGEAQAALQTFGGRVENLKNQIGDLAEEIGAIMIPALEKVLPLIQSFVGLFTQAKLRGEELLFNLGILTEEEEANAERRANAVEKEERRKIKTMQAAARKKKSIRKKEDDSLNQAIKKQLAFEFEEMKKQEEQKQQLEAIRKQNFTSTLQFISSLSTSKNKELAIIGKIGALALAKINTARAITLALASAPPPFNFALAAAVGVAGAAQIATIAGVQLAEGGIVQARPGGVQATIGEGGRDEAVIPLDDAESPLGLTINFNGPVLGGEENARDLAKMLDAEFADLRRNNESVAFGFEQ